MGSAWRCPCSPQPLGRPPTPASTLTPRGVLIYPSPVFRGGPEDRDSSWLLSAPLGLSTGTPHVTREWGTGHPPWAGSAPLPAKPLSMLSPGTSRALPLLPSAAQCHLLRETFVPTYPHPLRLPPSLSPCPLQVSSLCHPSLPGICCLLPRTPLDSPCLEQSLALSRPSVNY